MELTKKLAMICLFLGQCLSLGASLLSRSKLDLQTKHDNSLVRKKSVQSLQAMICVATANDDDRVD